MTELEKIAFSISGYLNGVLDPLPTQPANRVDELLPHRRHSATVIKTGSPHAYCSESEAVGLVQDLKGDFDAIGDCRLSETKTRIGPILLKNSKFSAR